MYIRANDNGNIAVASIYEIVDSVFYSGVIPNDFMELFPLGKYLFLNQEIIEVNGWVKPDKKEF